MSILRTFFEQQKSIVLDGGLATELEARGHDLSSDLWSAELILKDPSAIRDVHFDYLQAGADCIIAATYQATMQGLQTWGLSPQDATETLQKAVTLALEARDQFLENKPAGRLAPLVAASIGPYGAYLANGAEYTGDYDLDRAGLVEFHRERWHILANSGADLLSAETIPSYPETEALLELSHETKLPAWFSFSCQNERQIADGTLLADCGRILDSAENVIAIGINCTKPRYVEALIGELRSVTNKPIVVYPNSGEAWVNRQWVESVEGSAENFALLAQQWHNAGATLIGGCCRTGPEHIRLIRKELGQR